MKRKNNESWMSFASAEQTDEMEQKQLLKRDAVAAKTQQAMRLSL